MSHNKDILQRIEVLKSRATEGSEVYKESMAKIDFGSHNDLKEALERMDFTNKESFKKAMSILNDKISKL